MKKDCMKRTTSVKLFHIVISLCIGAVTYWINLRRLYAFPGITLPCFILPDWAIPITMICFYILVGKAAALISLSGNAEKSDALFIYAVQHGVCFLCCVFFFHFKEFFLCMCWGLFLLLLAALMCARFFRCEKNSIKLLIPYHVLLLYCFAIIFATWLINR